MPAEIQTRDTRSGAATDVELAGENLSAIQKCWVMPIREQPKAMPVDT